MSDIRINLISNLVLNLSSLYTCSVYDYSCQYECANIFCVENYFLLRHFIDVNITDIRFVICQMICQGISIPQFADFRGCIFSFFHVTCWKKSSPPQMIEIQFSTLLENLVFVELIPETISKNSNSFHQT